MNSTSQRCIYERAQMKEAEFAAHDHTSVSSVILRVIKMHFGLFSWNFRSECDRENDVRWQEADFDPGDRSSRPVWSWKMILILTCELTFKAACWSFVTRFMRSRWITSLLASWELEEIWLITFVFSFNVLMNVWWCNFMVFYSHYFILFSHFCQTDREIK